MADGGPGRGWARHLACPYRGDADGGRYRHIEFCVDEPNELLHERHGVAVHGGEGAGVDKATFLRICTEEGLRAVEAEVVWDNRREFSPSDEMMDAGAVRSAARLTLPFARELRFPKEGA